MKRGLFLGVAVAIASVVAAQEQAKTEIDKQQYVKYKLMIRPLELVIPNISLTAERHFYRHSLGLTLAFKPATRESGTITGAKGLFGNYRSSNMLNEAYNAITAGVNAKTYFHPAGKKDMYIDGQLSYRHWWFDNKHVAYPNVEGYRFAGTRSERMDVYSGKILLGYSAVGNKGKKTRLVADFYGGLDIRYRSWKYITKDGSVMDVYNSYRKETGNYWGLNPYLGMQVGIGR